jgi:hypothetical protein
MIAGSSLMAPEGGVVDLAHLAAFLPHSIIVHPLSSLEGFSFVSSILHS